MKPIRKKIPIIIVTSLAVILIFAVIFVIADDSRKPRLTAEYVGYYISDGQTYPIVRVGGKEYSSNRPQKVRDASYIGNAVEIIKTDGNADMSDSFRIDWDAEIS